MLFILLFVFDLTFGQPEKPTKKQEFPALKPLEEALPPSEEEDGFTVVTSKKSKSKKKAATQQTSTQAKQKQPERRGSQQQPVVRPKETSPPQTTQVQKESRKEVQPAAVRPKTVVPQPQTSEQKVVRPKIPPIQQPGELPRFEKRERWDTTAYRERRRLEGISRQELFPESAPFIYKGKGDEALKKAKEEKQRTKQTLPVTPITQVTPIPFPSQGGLLPSTIVILQNYDLCRKYKYMKKPVYLFVFVQYWPGDKCDREMCSLPKSTEMVKEGFWLHGFWPQYYTNNRVFLCCIYPRSDLEIEKQMMDNKPLLQQIRNKWMSVDRCRFAIYQWDKHGTCSQRVYPGYNGPMDYMYMALNLYDRHDIWKILQESDLKVETEKFYNIKDLRKVIQGVYKTDIVFHCIEKEYIHDFRVCFNVEQDPFNPGPAECPDKYFTREKNKCEQMVKLKKFPFHLLDPKTAPRNNCEY
ncbi:hypothetical protein EIN_294610 [Entamoeba invadens IP1]|uniref:Uncharacterized protein n=1 Tax=Entamoeba invadens IP1 TaxID=370355 RepID=L7FPD9_ENTIV|nr:hypothetical protein EIN_294610 [Entamoeba invadens IP1]ELP90971.1 hypothetical protein EIN_294610 [Entamoeba invadens IP1]|eukprot:XP_004257742.1 hypothetical protein EIN_294610 [Entamoeba invadens IP1]